MRASFQSSLRTLQLPQSRFHEVRVGVCLPDPLDELRQTPLSREARAAWKIPREPIDKCVVVNTQASVRRIAGALLIECSSQLSELHPATLLIHFLEKARRPLCKSKGRQRVAPATAFTLFSGGHKEVWHS